MGQETPESGFRRFPRFRDALLVTDVALSCGDRPEGRPAPPQGYDEPDVVEAVRCHLDALRTVSRKLSKIRPQRRRFLALAPEGVRFAAADDVTEQKDRFCAVVAPAYARADTVAWCQAAGNDDEGLVAFAARVDAFLPDLDRFRPNGLAALRRRRHADEGARRLWYARTERALIDLTELAEAARKTASALGFPGRRRETARRFFVLRLAGIHALITGMKPPLDGGNEGAVVYAHGERKRRPDLWHDLINSALDLTGLRSEETKTDSILRDAAADVWAVAEIEDLADGERSRSDGRWRLDCDRLPGSDIESEVGVAPEWIPTSREEAHSDPAVTYVGRTGRG